MKFLEIKLSNNPSGPTPASLFIEKLRAKYPANPFNPREIVMLFDGEEAMVAFELQTHLRDPRVVYVSFMHSHPQKQGWGTRGMQELQNEARSDGISLELIPWDKSHVSKSALKRFYKKMGFSSNRTTDTMQWHPTST